MEQKALNLVTKEKVYINEVLDEELSHEFICVTTGCNCALIPCALNSDKVRPYFKRKANVDHVDSCPYSFVQSVSENETIEKMYSRLMRDKESKTKDTYNRKKRLFKSSSNIIHLMQLYKYVIGLEPDEFILQTNRKKEDFYFDKDNYFLNETIVRQDIVLLQVELKSFYNPNKSFKGKIGENEITIYFKDNNFFQNVISTILIENNKKIKGAKLLTLAKVSYFDDSGAMYTQINRNIDIIYD